MEQILKAKTIEAVKAIYNKTALDNDIQIQFTNKEIEGDYTIVVFPLLQYSKNKPENTAKELGVYLKNKISDISSYNVIKGFLNIRMTTEYWIEKLNKISFGEEKPDKNSTPLRYMVEFSSPNTNKPLHLGHIRNNLIGDSVSRILRAAGSEVIRVNLVNDRGIHICKSMLAYNKWGNNCSPESTGIKGDKFVGDYYVKFEQEYKKEIAKLVTEGSDEKDAALQSTLMKEAREMLQQWEKGDMDTMNLWRKMNNWVYEGFEETYKSLGISFERTYYESQTYTSGKEIVFEGLEKGLFNKKDDGSIWVDLTDYGLDEKLLLRSDGTSVYITQDIGTALQRFSEFNLDKHIYVVGNEQNYHFQVLKLVLKKLGFDWADNIYHMSYGMVELPEGKMKSREGTVVDADDLINEMLQTATSMSSEHGKLNEVDTDYKIKALKMIALGALKYFILKVDPKKTITFNPRESIDFNGNTGPFIQYTYARICSILRNAEKMNIKFNGKASEETNTVNKEIELLRLIDKYKYVLREAARNFDPGIIANYCFEIAKEFNQYYQEYSILKEKDINILHFRLLLCKLIKETMHNGMNLLGIEMPERM
ncbi:MAG: arginine--tRNA ligase [Bacteroidales bacterium]|nr:arginine--tRNA ligase [Bacteroidales bacterium]HOY39352.1 arginine--tRNA ligase [Bacteroidales bacterium]HQP03811.1 arginine--tRNA ligase [Bacteroidales bacterium]